MEKTSFPNLKIFTCRFCKNSVSLADKSIGTKNRNHCPKCLYSLHVDLEIPGDRSSQCQGLMEPIGLTFKKSKGNKYQKEDQKGELMLVHHCQKCDKVSLNRLAADDETTEILKVFEKSKEISDEIKKALEQNTTDLARTEEDYNEIKKQLLGKR